MPRRTAIVAIVAIVLVLGAGAALLLRGPDGGTGATGSTSAPSPTGSARAAPGFPDAASTGVPAGVRLRTVRGDLRTTSPGQVVQGLRITGDLVVASPGVVVRDTRVLGRIRTPVDDGLTLVDSDIGTDGCHGPSTQALMIAGSVTATRTHFHGGGADLVQVQGGRGVSIVDSLLDGGCEYPGDHYDAVQLYDPGAVAHLRIVGSTVDARSSAGTGNAAVFWADRPGPGSTLSVVGSRLAGGNYTTALYDAGAGSGVSIDVRDNVYVASTSRYGACASSKSVPADGREGVRFTGNRLDDGTPLPDC